MGMPARRVCLGKLSDELDRYAGHFAKLLSQDCGFDEAQAAAEVSAAVAALRGASVGQTGVIGVVLDAGRPLAGFAETIAPALMAGAAIVVKPSPKAPSAVFALTELTSRCEWPAGVVNLLQGDMAALEAFAAPPSTAWSIAAMRRWGLQGGAIAEAAGKPFEMVAA